MKAQYVSDKITPLPESQALRAIRDAYRIVMNDTPTAATLAVLMAQCALETGRWRSCHWHNWGNVKASEKYEGYYTLFRCNEIINGKVKWFSPGDGYEVPPGHPQCRFRAHMTSADGALQHLKFLWGYPRYRAAWGAARDGDPGAFCRELKAAGYFTANLAPYTKAVESLTKEYLGAILQSQVLAELAIIKPIDISVTVEHVEPERSATSDADMVERISYLVEAGMAQLAVDFWEKEYRLARDAILRGELEE